MRPLPNLAELSRVDRDRRAGEFYSLAHALMIAQGNPSSALNYAEKMKAPAAVVEHLKTAVAGIDLSESLAYPPMAAEFLASLVNASAFDAVLADANQVKLHSRFGIVTANATGATPAPYAGKPVGKLVVAGNSLTEQKAVALIVASNETLRFGVAAANLIGQSLRASVAAATDSIFVAGLIAATTPIASTGTDAAAVLHDLRLLLDAIEVDAGSRLHLIVGADVAKRLSVIASTTGAPAFAVSVAGGTLAQIPVHVSDAAGDAVVLVDARALAMAADAVRLRTSQQAAIEMDSVPSNTPAGGSPLAPTESNLVSMFQTNSTALLCERYFGFTVARSSGVASLSNVEWGLVGSPPA